MMLPQGITITTPNGGSLYQQQLVQPSQAGSFARSHAVTAGNQGAAGAMDQGRSLMAGMNTAQHQLAMAALNFRDGAPDNEVRNAQKAAANALVAQYKEAMFRHVPGLRSENLQRVGWQLRGG